VRHRRGRLCYTWLAAAKGEYKFLHPNDDVNMSQSTNDTYPTAAKLAIVMGLKDALQSMEQLKGALERPRHRLPNDSTRYWRRLVIQPSTR
jgi:aspartate ammonia-lyase